MDPTSVKEPVAVAEAELKATAMNAAANHQSLGATISPLDRLMGANGSNFIEPALHGAVRSDNGTSVPLSINRTFDLALQNQRISLHPLFISDYCRQTHGQTRHCPQNHPAQLRVRRVSENP